MRKLSNIALFLIAAVLMFAVSCEREERIPRTPAAIPGFEDIELEDNCIILKFDPSFVKAQTKAGDTERGLDDLNENTINTIDCFFYRTGETDSAPIFRAIGRTVENTVEIDSTECYVKVYYNDQIAETLFGDTKGGTCDAFVIANAALNYNGTCSINDLREMMLEYDFSQQEVQPYFTMCSQETAQVTLYTIQHPDYPSDPTKRISTAAGRVPLYRCASKMQLFLKLPESFKSDDNSVYEPCPDQLGGMKVRIHSGSKRTRVYSDYTLASSDYIHFDDRAISTLANEDLVEGKEDFNYSHTPFYSFPMSWSDLDDNASNYIFSIPWRMIKNKEGEDVNGEPERRYYKLSANVIGRKFEYNHYYRTFVYVQSLGDKELDKAEIIDNCHYIISNWVHEGIATSAGSESISGEFIRYNFLVVEPDDVTLNNESTYTFKFSSSADLKNGEVIIDKICYSKYNTGVGVDYEVAVGASSVTNNSIDGNTYSVTYNYAKGEIYFSHPLNEVYEERVIHLTVTNKDEISQKVTIHQRPAIMLELHAAGDVFVNGYFGRVQNASYEGRSSTLTATYYTRSGLFGSWRTNTYTGSLNPYYHCNTSLQLSVTNSTQYAPTGTWYYGQGTQYTAGGFSWSISTDYGTVVATTNNMNASISANFYTAEINLSAFNATNHTYSSNGEDVEYRIADPRVKASASAEDGGYGDTWSLNGYLYWNGSSEATQAWNNPGDIMICSLREADRNLIAPRFLISSALNANTGLTWEQVIKRGATYQEAGYPAGRWRLPSEAEIAFIVARQRDGVIPNLYATETYYWAGSGRLVYVPNDVNASITFYTAAEAEALSNDTTFSCRFVYDLWYCGDTAASTNEYHPNGHNTSY
ncbi:MAG: hypothetical protein J6X57_01690 [Bacteroidales bacterium]|nr:hypothetical protein [Bacteroidales bacterium]